jgi:hypothetical protein
MHKSATKCNETIGKWCKNKHGASKIIDTFETYQSPHSSIKANPNFYSSARFHHLEPKTHAFDLHQANKRVKTLQNRAINADSTFRRYQWR